MSQRMNLYFLGFTDLFLLFCFDGISKKRKNAPLSAALLSFCLVCEISLCTSFQTFLRREFVTALYLVKFFATKPFVYTACFAHNQLFSFGRNRGTYVVLTVATFWEQKVQTQHPAVCSLLLPLLWESSYECVGFSLHKCQLIPSFFKVLDIKPWYSLNFQASLSVDSPFGCPLRQFKGASSLPSILYLSFPTACLSFDFPPSS